MSVNYIRTGDYLIPDLKLPEENRPIGKWGRMHRDYLKEYHPIQYNNLVLSGNLWTYLADLNKQAEQRMEMLITQMKSAEGITEALKAADPMGWTQRMSNITARVEEIVREELIYA
ncbi:MAG: TnpV protein [Oscillospiraceae bacterium]|nr:TnpV protein [Oscillospiraceae bacterium]